MVPTFCVPAEALLGALALLTLPLWLPALVLGNARTGDAVLPIDLGDGGGEPKRESSSSSCVSNRVCAIGICSTWRERIVSVKYTRSRLSSTPFNDSTPVK